MSISYSRAINTTVAGAAAAALEIIAGTNSAKITEIVLTLGAATASVYALGTPAAIGNNPTTPVPLLSEQDASVSVATLATAWTTPPTAPAAFYKRASMPASIGAQLVWTFPQGLIIPANSSLVVWNLTANSANTDVSVRAVQG